MVIFVRAVAWPDGRHYTAVVVATSPHIDDAIGQMTCAPRKPFRWLFLRNKTWGPHGLRECIKDAVRLAANVPDEHYVSIQIVWHPREPEGEVT
jgi:hypothetical protein